MSDELQYVEAICIPFADSGRIAWRFSFCRPHADEYIALSRRAGDSGFWHLFGNNRDYKFCQWCAALEIHPDRDTPMAFPQVPVHTSYPPED